MANFMGKLLKKRIKGSYTVEAAILMPLGFALVLLVIFYSLILYDKVALCAKVHETAQKEGFQQVWEKEAAVGKERDDFFGALTKGSIWQERTADTLGVWAEGKSVFLTPLIENLFLLHSPYVRADEKVDFIFGEQMIRKQMYFGGWQADGSTL